MKHFDLILTQLTEKLASISIISISLSIFERMNKLPITSFLDKLLFFNVVDIVVNALFFLFRDTIHQHKMIISESKTIKQKKLQFLPENCCIEALWNSEICGLKCDVLPDIIGY